VLTFIVNVIEIARESYKLKVRGRGVANQAAAHGSH
jgi:hypothetical protein